MSKTDERIASLRRDYRPDAEVPPVLARVRDDRAMGRQSSPSALYFLAEADADLYFHAMVERGYIVAPSGERYSTCPICDFVLDQVAA